MRQKTINELNLSDEHMQHVYRFLDLGKFDRREFEIMRGYCRWKADNFKKMNEATALAAAAKRSDSRTKR